MRAPSLPPSFGRLAWANLAAQSAEQLSLAAVPLIAVLLLNASIGQVGMLTATGTLPFLLLSLPMGLLADRMPRQRLMLWAEGLRLLSLLLLLLVLHSAQLSIGWLAVLGFMGAVGTVGFSVATPGLVSSLVPREALAKANARLEVARSVAFAGGPAIAGTLVSWAGASLAFTLAAVLSAMALVLLVYSGSTAVQPHSGARRQLLHEISQGAVFAWSHALLRPLLVTGAVFNVAWFMLQAAYIPYAIRSLGFSAAAVGTTLAWYGLGMIVGALLTARIVAWLPLGRAIQVGPMAGVAAAACLAATLAAPANWLPGLCFFLLGAGPMVWTITTTTLRQHITPDILLGRVSAVFLTINAGARPAGAALGGWVGMTWGEPACLIAALAGFALQVAVVLNPRVSSLRDLPGAPSVPNR